MSTPDFSSPTTIPIPPSIISNYYCYQMIIIIGIFFYYNHRYHHYHCYPTTIPLPGTIISPYCPISCAGALPLSMCSFMNHLFRSINGIFIGHESDHCLAWSVTESVSLAVFSLSVVQFYEPFVKKPKWNFYIAGLHDTFEYMWQQYE